MLPDFVETLIVGGGQAGLTMSHMLSQRGSRHLVLERGRIAERWRSERWDGLRFQFPNWSVRLPDMPFVRDDPDGFATSGEIVAYLEAYKEDQGERSLRHHRNRAAQGRSRRGLCCRNFGWLLAAGIASALMTRTRAGASRSCRAGDDVTRLKSHPSASLTRLSAHLRGISA